MLISTLTVRFSYYLFKNLSFFQELNYLSLLGRDRRYGNEADDAAIVLHGENGWQDGKSDPQGRCGRFWRWWGLARGEIVQEKSVGQA